MERYNFQFIEKKWQDIFEKKSFIEKIVKQNFTV